MSQAFDRLKEEFLGEAEETLATFRRDLQELHDGAGSSPEPTLVDRVFRTAHSLKGVLGMFGLDDMAQVAHAMESLLEEIRGGRLIPEKATSDVLLEANETLHLLLEVAAGRASSESASIGAILRKLVEETARAAPEAPAPDDPLVMAWEHLSLEVRQKLHDVVDAGDTVVLVECAGVAAEDERLSMIQHAIESWGVVRSLVPGPARDGETVARLRWVVSGSAGLFGLMKAVGPHQAEVLPCETERVLRYFSKEHAPSQPEEVVSEAHPGAASFDGGHPEPNTESVAPEKDPSANASSLSSTLRVRIERVDRLLQALAGILHSKRVLENAAAVLSEVCDDRLAITELGQTLRTLDRRIRAMQNEVLEVRLVSLGSLFPKLERIAWSAAREAGKSVKLVQEGGAVEVDKEIVDALLAPLAHGLRNAIDHGIEDEAARVAAGKSTQGRVLLRARSEGAMAVVEICDDGAGVDLARVLGKGRARQLLPLDREPTRAEILEVLFHPGFSTRDEISSLSGRGVGLDAVRDAVQAFGGTVELETGPSGTTMRLRLPTTRAILEGLVVHVAGQAFVVPVSPLVQVVKIRASEVENGRERGHLEVQGEELPFADLAEALELSRPPESVSQARPALIFEWAGKRGILLVDRVGTRGDVVTQGLGLATSRLAGVVGSTEIGEGRALLLLDPAALLESAIKRRAAEVTL